MKGTQLFRSFDATFPAEVRKRRRALDITQEEFATIAGLDPTLLSRIESGERAFKHPALLHLGLAALELLGEDYVEAAVMRESRKRAKRNGR